MALTGKLGFLALLTIIGLALTNAQVHDVKKVAKAEVEVCMMLNKQLVFLSCY